MKLNNLGVKLEEVRNIQCQIFEFDCLSIESLKRSLFSNATMFGSSSFVGGNFDPKFEGSDQSYHPRAG
jgi:hypothetical protein